VQIFDNKFLCFAKTLQMIEIALIRIHSTGQHILSIAFAHRIAQFVQHMPDGEDSACGQVDASILWLKNFFWLMSIGASP
jgi:hypothetical protein